MWKNRMLQTIWGDGDDFPCQKYKLTVLLRYPALVGLSNIHATSLVQANHGGGRKVRQYFLVATIAPWTDSLTNFGHSSNNLFLIKSRAQGNATSNRGTLPPVRLRGYTIFFYS